MAYFPHTTCILSYCAEQGDSCSINGVCYLKQNEIATVNTSGQLKVWDIRDSQGTLQPARLFLPYVEVTEIFLSVELLTILLWS